MKYRPEIDGLRAVAVLSVVLYHANVPGFAAGFVGVDVFFVISGFLISSILLSELRRESFSLSAFYERRVRRIFPPLFAMLALTSLIAYAILLPKELSAFGSSLFKATVFGSNVGFWLDTGYFDRAADSKPLLHTWSLSVEEQFYLVFPLVLAFTVRKLGRFTLHVVLVLFASSFAYWLDAPRDSAFYLAHCRAWQLLLGVVIALGIVPVPTRSITRASVSMLGMGLIGMVVTGFADKIPFEGATNALATVGAAMFLHAEQSERSPVGRLLGSKLPVAIGLISYALYLWHWPALVFGRMLSVRPLLIHETALLLAGATLLATLSRFWLEEPVRRGQLLKSRDAVFGAAAITMVSAAVLGFSFVEGNGLRERLPKDALAIHDGFQSSRKTFRKACMHKGIKQTPAWSRCYIGAPAKTSQFLLWGDSHAAALAPSLAAIARGARARGTILYRNGCQPLLGVIRGSRDRTTCDAIHERARELIESQPAQFGTVVLAARWANWLEGRDFGHTHTLPKKLYDRMGQLPASASSKAVFERGLSRTLDFLRGWRKRVVIVGPVPEVGYHVPIELARAKWLGHPVDIRPTTRDFFARQKRTFEIMSRLQQRYHFQIVYPHLALCGKEHCEVEYDGKALYGDEDHLVAAAANLVLPMLGIGLHGALITAPPAAPSLVAPSLVAPSLVAPSLVAPSLVAPSLVAPSLVAPGPVAP